MNDLGMGCRVGSTPGVWRMVVGELKSLGAWSSRRDVKSCKDVYPTFAGTGVSASSYVLVRFRRSNWFSPIENCFNAES